MSTSRAQRLEELFQEAITMPPDQRSEYLAEACTQDKRLLDEVKRLLEHDEGAPPEFMRSPELCALDTGSTSNLELVDQLIGVTVGQYEITDRIASGGMGAVYKAIQKRPQRTVAIKIMHEGMVSGEAVRRFEHESHILAHLRHPYIAQVFEAGTDKNVSGARRQPISYFAMEYVSQAATLTDFAQAHQLTLRDCLELFSKVCEGVHHGHLKGIVHRDLKPDNILVDSEGTPKIIDFGIARATDADLVLTTLKTDIGQLVGTIQYMSPEQCTGDPLDIDLRTDIYSLGLILYELLCGRPPLDLGRVPVFEATRLIRETEPDRPGEIDRKLRGDLETVILTAIEKDPERRYQTTMDLCRDVQRFLNGEPVDVRPPSVRTRMIRWSLKHPVLITTVACLLIAGLTLSGTAVTTWLYGFRPHRIIMVNGGEEVRLIAYNGRTVREWIPKEPETIPIRFAQCVEQVSTLGGRRLVVIGFAWAYGATQFPRSLCAFDMDGDFSNPLWERQISDDELPTQFRNLKPEASAIDFAFSNGWLADVFPDVPGEEVVAVFQHFNSTHSALRIYDLGGRILYQVWIDMYITQAYFMTEPGLLVLSGLWGSAYWYERGYLDERTTHPEIVVAIRPIRDFLLDDYISEDVSDDPHSATWIRCLWPPGVTLEFGHGHVARPVPHYDRRSHVDFIARRKVKPFGSLRWTLNKKGETVAGPNMDDSYKISQGALPKVSEIELRDLPPVSENDLEK